MKRNGKHPLQDWAQREYRRLLPRTDHVLDPEPLLRIQTRRRHATCSGTWIPDDHTVVLLLGKRTTKEDIAMVLCHELAHACLPVEEDHGDKWRSVFVHLVEDAYAVRPDAIPASAHDLDLAVEAAIESCVWWLLS